MAQYVLTIKSEITQKRYPLEKWEKSCFSFLMPEEQFGGTYGGLAVFSQVR